MSTEDDSKQSKSYTATILKWIGIATAVVSLTLGINQLNNLWNARQQRIATEIKIASLIKDAHTQRDADDYETGWKTLEQAHALNPDSRMVQDEQVDFAMKWLRDLLFINKTDQYIGVTSRLLPILYHAANETKGQEAADILAHIGWANYLQRFEVSSHLKIAELFQEAVNKDTLNAYAHAMWGFWLMKQERAGENLKNAAVHFDDALRGKRDTVFVRLLQLWAFQQYDDPASKGQLFIAINNMRINNESISPDMKERIVDRAYNYYSRDAIESISKKLSPADHLKTFLYLTNRMDFSDHPYRKFSLAQLTEEAGDIPKALSIYQSMNVDSTLKMYSWYDQIGKALKRINRH
ncbi:MAG: hypothetical protein ABI723_26650 [Bacteroidia bacterium]